MSRKFKETFKELPFIDREELREFVGISHLDYVVMVSTEENPCAFWVAVEGKEKSTICLRDSICIKDSVKSVPRNGAKGILETAFDTEALNFKMYKGYLVEENGQYKLDSIFSKLPEGFESKPVELPSW